jgi:hypothetical protein
MPDAVIATDLTAISVTAADPVDVVIASLRAAGTGVPKSDTGTNAVMVPLRARTRHQGAES